VIGDILGKWRGEILEECCKRGDFGEKRGDRGYLGRRGYRGD